MDLTRAKRLVGVGLVSAAGFVVGTDIAAVAAGVVAALALTTTDRGTAGLAAASLGLAAAGVLLATAVGAAPTIPLVATTLAVTVGVAAGVHAGLGGQADGLVAAGAAVALALTGVLATLAARPGPVVSLMGARLVTASVGWLLLLAPLSIGTVAGGLAVGRWRTADLPPWYVTAGAPAAVLLIGLVAGPGVPDVGAIVDGTPGPRLAVLLWGAAAALIASALGGAAAAADQRFRRPGAWVGAAVGPLAVLAVVALDGGVFLAAFVAAVPGTAGPIGAAIETGDPAVMTALVGMAFVGIIGAAAALPTLLPRVRDRLGDRAPEVAVGALLFAVASKPPEPYSIVLDGGLVVAAWLYLADRPTIEPPPRTVLVRTGRTTLAVVVATFVATRPGQFLPRTDPGLGGLVLLAGVAVLGVAIAK